MGQSYSCGSLQSVNLNALCIHWDGGKPGSSCAENGAYRSHLRVFNGYAVTGFDQDASCDVQTLLDSRHDQDLIRAARYGSCAS
jgi:hypothetical protein